VKELSWLSSSFKLKEGSSPPHRASRWFPTNLGFMAERMMRTVFDWEHFALYLSGPMDFAHDGGKGWREDWTERLTEIGINPKQIYNPCKKPFHGAQFDLDDEAAIGRECRENEDWEKFDDLMGQIMHVDLRLVDKADIVLVNIPKINWDNEHAKRLSEFNDVFKGNEPLGLAVHQLLHDYCESRVPTYGTIHEVVIAHQQRKPIFIVWEETGKKDCSAWLMRLVGHKNIFSHIDLLVQYLHEISHGEKAFDANEWLLLDPK